MLIKGWLCFKQWINMLTDHMAIHQVSLTSCSWINCTCTTLIKHGFKSFTINCAPFQPMIRTAEVFLRDATTKKITADIKFKFWIKLPNILPSIYDNSIFFLFLFFAGSLFGMLPLLLWTCRNTKSIWNQFTSQYFCSRGISVSSDGLWCADLDDCFMHQEHLVTKSLHLL